MTCTQAREMVSARIDDELSAEHNAQLDVHLASCASCTAYQDDAFSLRRALRMRAVNNEPAHEVPPVDLAGSLRGVTLLRYALAIIGATLVIINIPSIVSPDGTVASHLDRHDGVFGIALGIGMLAVAAKPHRAIGLVPLTSALSVLMLVVAIADLVTGRANLLAEAVHIVQFAGLACLWVISGGPSRLPQYLHTLRRVPAASGA